MTSLFLSVLAMLLTMVLLNTNSCRATTSLGMTDIESESLMDSEINRRMPQSSRNIFNTLDASKPAILPCGKVNMHCLPAAHGQPGKPCDPYKRDRPHWIATYCFPVLEGIPITNFIFFFNFVKCVLFMLIVDKNKSCIYLSLTDLYVNMNFTNVKFSALGQCSPNY